MAKFLSVNQAFGVREADSFRRVPMLRREGKPTPMHRFHVIGCPGSGATLMSRLLQHAYQMSGQSLREQSLFDPVEPSAYPFLSCSTADTEKLHEAFSADSELFVIALVRDPRSVVTRIDRTSAARNYSAGFGQWRQAMQAIERLSPKDRCMQVRYESLMANPVGVQEQIEAQFGFLRREQSFATFNGKVLSNPQPPAERWRAHLPRLKRELENHPDLADWLIATGYEANHNWIGALESVKPAVSTAPSGMAIKNLVKGFDMRHWWRVRRYLAERTKLGAVS